MHCNMLRSFFLFLHLPLRFNVHQGLDRVALAIADVPTSFYANPFEPVIDVPVSITSSCRSVASLWYLLFCRFRNSESLAVMSFVFEFATNKTTLLCYFR